MNVIIIFLSFLKSISINVYLFVYRIVVNHFLFEYIDMGKKIKPFITDNTDNKQLKDTINKSKADYKTVIKNMLHIIK